MTEFKSHAQWFISGMQTYCQQADTFAGMSFGQLNELWDSAYAVNTAIKEFSKKVNQAKEQREGGTP